MLEIYAGSNALKTIQEHGFKQELFTHFLGASGGPKWFTLFGLDKYLFGEFFAGRTTELNIIGSSAGAFRASCFAQQDPIAAINKLAIAYAEVRYSDKPTPNEITLKAIDLLDHILAESGIDEIINNPIFKAHFIVAKAKGFTASDNKALLGLGLVGSLLLNKIDRKLLSKQYERYVYKSPSSKLEINDPYHFATHSVNFTPENIKQALLASGSIPLVMEGIKNIHGSEKGMYRDGGIIDYHFDFGIDNAKGLTLYPHFNSQPKAGWFDKSSSRKVQEKHYDSTVLLAPSAQFIQSLPYQKIPDRTDFTKMDADTRIAYWKTVLVETERLADDFKQVVEHQNISKIKPLVL